eukprot:355965-Chlamydomonas_euryale.AAC.5
MEDEPETSTVCVLARCSAELSAARDACQGRSAARRRRRLVRAARRLLLRRPCVARAGAVEPCRLSRPACRPCRRRRRCCCRGAQAAALCG